MSLIHSLKTSRLVLSTRSPLYVERFGRSLRFCYLELEEEAISDGLRSENDR